MLMMLLLTAGCTYPDLQEPTSASTPVPVPVSLWDAYRRAEATVRSEVSDAVLVSASTQWQGVEPDRLLESPTQWSFVFYSPDQRTVFDLVANADQAEVVNHSQVWTTPQALKPGGWEKGPRDAVSIFLAYGGREFMITHPETTVSIHLSTDGEGRSVWDIAALDVSTRETFSLQIDAASLQVLRISP